MTQGTIRGIGTAGDILEGEFRSIAGQWTLQLSDGLTRPFGSVTPYSVEAVRQLHDLGSVITSRIPKLAAMEAFSSPSSLILEVTPFCPVGCPTCIASSIPTRVGELNLSGFQNRARQILTDPIMPEGTAIMVSGGEPTEHPDFFALVSSSEFLKFRHRFVITSGIRFVEKAFVQRFCECSPGTQLYLQYDSFDAEHLRLIRGSDLTDVRERVIANCEDCGLWYTLVCVVFRSVNDGIACEIVERHLPRQYCAGITFQPIKFVGRNDFARHEHNLNTFDLVAGMQNRLERGVGIALAPHPANPVNWAIGYADGLPPIMATLYEESRRKRVAVIWHTDRENYVLESVAEHPIAFAEPDRVVPLEVHYGGI